MADDLLETARCQAEKAKTSVRATALLRIGRAQAALDASLARQALLEGLAAARTLQSPMREYLFQEAREVAAAASPELIAEIPTNRHDGPGHFQPPGFESVQIVQTMLTYGHVDAAFDFLLQENDPNSFPFMSVGAVLHRLDPQTRNLLFVG
jgi:hypothetical protein